MSTNSTQLESSSNVRILTRGLPSCGKTTRFGATLAHAAGYRIAFADAAFERCMSA